MKRLMNRLSLAMPAVVLLGAAGAFGLVSGCEDTAPDVEVDEWSAITDREWPPGDIPEDARLDVNRQRTNVAVVLDMSGSMGDGDCSGDHDSKASAARAALATWVEAVPRDANLGLIAFADSRVQTLVPLGTDNRERFVQAANEVYPSGGTPLLSGMKAAHAMLIERARFQLGYGRYQIVMITDGEHSNGENPLPEVEAVLGNPANPVEIHTIGFCIDDSALKQPGLVQYQSAHDPEQLAAGLSKVLAESSSFEPMESFDEQ
jgi:hypothetical protein